MVVFASVTAAVTGMFCVVHLATASERIPSNVAGPCATAPCLNGGICTVGTTSTSVGHRRLQNGVCTLSSVQSRADAVTQACCSKPTEDCSSGLPATCDADCAAVLVPYYQDCQEILQRLLMGNTIQTAIQRCDINEDYQCTCPSEWTGDNCEVRASLKH